MEGQTSKDCRASRGERCGPQPDVIFPPRPVVGRRTEVVHDLLGCGHQPLEVGLTAKAGEIGCHRGEINGWTVAEPPVSEGKENLFAGLGNITPEEARPDGKNVIGDELKCLRARLSGDEISRWDLLGHDGLLATRTPDDNTERTPAQFAPQVKEAIS